MTTPGTPNKADLLAAKRRARYTRSVSVDVNIDEFDDQAIRDEYEDRFGVLSVGGRDRDIDSDEFRLRMEAMRNAVLQGHNVMALQLAGDLARDYLGTAL